MKKNEYINRIERLEHERKKIRSLILNTNMSYQERATAQKQIRDINAELSKKYGEA